MGRDEMEQHPKHKQKKTFVILLVCIVTGFIIGYSYNLAEDNRQQSSSNMFYQTSNVYRQELIEQQKQNQELQQELASLEQQIRDYEQSFSTNNQTYEEQLREVNQIRLLLGNSKGIGKGIRVSLNDGKFDGTSNPNNFVIHESHIFSLLHELKIAGAEAIAINGKRLSPHSFISCNGPVIMIDGEQFPAPFIIEAVGNPNTLTSALNISGGIIDQLIMDNIVIELSEDDHITMASVQQGNS